MVLDFGYLKEIVKKWVVDKFDHSYLNDFFPIPTAEHMAQWIFLKLDVFLQDNFGRGSQLEKVRLYETSNSYAEVTK